MHDQVQSVLSHDKGPEQSNGENSHNTKKKEEEKKKKRKKKKKKKKDQDPGTHVRVLDSISKLRMFIQLLIPFKCEYKGGRAVLTQCPKL